MRKLFLVIAVVIAVPAVAADLSLMLRHRSQHTTSNVLDTVAGVSAPLLPWLDGEVAGRLSLSTKDLEAFDYKGELRAHPFSFWEVGLRVYQSNRLGDGLGLSQWLASTTLTGWFIPGVVAIYGTIGWHQRYVILRGNVGLPVFANSAHNDRDLAARLGFLVRPGERWLVQLGISTIEDFDVFNLNSPFGHVGVEYRPAAMPWTFSTYVRYRLLLGFGRLDELVVGFGARCPLGG